MRIVIDANVFISALNYPNGVVGKALDKAMKSEEELLLCDFVFDEVRRIIRRKFPGAVSRMEKFFDANRGSFKTITVPDAETEDEGRIRDEKDRPILRAAADRRGQCRPCVRDGVMKPRYAPISLDSGGGSHGIIVW